MKIISVMEKTTKGGKPYKSLQFEDNRSANMWEDDPRYSDAEDGKELPIELEKNGNFWNIIRADQPRKGDQTELSDMKAKITQMYEMIVQIHKATVFHDQEEVEGMVEYPSEDINPEDIPF